MSQLRPYGDVSGTEDRRAPRLFDDDSSHHKSMELAMVCERTCFGKREAESSSLGANRSVYAGIEALPIIARHSMRCSRRIRPYHRRANGNGQRGRTESKRPGAIGHDGDLLCRAGGSCCRRSRCRRGCRVAVTFRIDGSRRAANRRVGGRRRSRR